MRNTRMKHLLTALFLLAGGWFPAHAVPADPTPVTVTQPDGSTLTVRLRGDEFFHFYETLDGVPLVRSHSGAYYYARLQDGCLAATDVLAHQAEWRTPQENLTVSHARGIRSAFNTMARKARAEHLQTMETTIQKAPAQRAGAMQNWKGSQTGLVILVQFSDVKFRSNHPRELFERQFNEAGFNFEGASGSVYDYYYAQSNGQFELTMDVAGPVTMPKELAYYGKNANGSKNVHVQEMVAEAFRLADSEVDFSKYDWNKDGYVDNVFLVYAGFDESYSGNSEDYIWAHKWGTAQPVKVDGVYAQQYACAAEMFGWEEQSGNRLNGIGTPCHEMGHTLGLADLYDVDYSGAHHPESWSLMSGGNHLSNGQIPSNLTAYERAQMGWLQLTELTENTTVSDLQSLSREEKAYVIYNPAYRNECYVLENRQKEGYDSAQGGHGLLVFHIDFDKSVWDWNQPNDDVDHPRFLQIPAGGDYNNMASTPFPGSASINELTDYSHPFATLYNPNIDGEYKMHCNISDIKEQGGKISFTYSQDGQVELPKVYNISTASRGNWAVNAEGTRFLSAKEAGIDPATNATTDARLQFILSRQDDATYIYNVYAHKFVNPDLTLSIEPKSPVTLQEEADGTQVVSFDTGHCININADGTLSVSSHNTPDEGNKVRLEEAESDVFTAWTPNRGGWAVNANGSRFVSSTEAGLGTMVNAFRTQLQFRLVNIGGATYLYSMHAHKYVNSSCALSATPRNPVIITQQDNGTNIVKFDDTHYINIGGDNTISVSNWSTADEGNMMVFEPVPLEMTLSTVHWTYALDGKPYKEFSNYLERNMNVKDHSLDFYEVKSQSATSVGESIQTSIDVDGTEHLPFPKDAWMLLRRGGSLARLGSDASAKPCSDVYDWEAVADAGNLWMISGSLTDGFTMRHKGTGTTLSVNDKTWQPVKTWATGDDAAFSLKAQEEDKYLTYDNASQTISFADLPSENTSFAYQPAGFACDALLTACLRIPEGTVGKPSVADEKDTQEAMENAHSQLQEANAQDAVEIACQYIDLCNRIAGSPLNGMTEGLYYLVADNESELGALGYSDGAFDWAKWNKNVNQVCRISTANADQHLYTIFSPNHSLYLATAGGEASDEPSPVRFSPADEPVPFLHYGHHLMEVDGQPVFAHNNGEGNGTLSADQAENATSYWYIVPATTMCLSEAACSTNSVGFAAPCLPFAVKVPADCPTETLFAASLQEDGSTIVVNAVESIPPLTGFICSKKEYSNSNSEFTFEIVDADVPPIATCLKGSLQAMPAGEFSGALLATVRGKLGFSLKSGTSLPANTAYIETDTSFLPIDLESTAIHAVRMDEPSTYDAVYNLNGQRISAPQPGSLYIKNGKKFIFMKR